MLLLDEPLGALDRPLHDRLVSELRDLFDEIHQTAVYVTHDVAEAFALGSRVAVMRAGRILQVASPEQLWAAPADAWVARFIGLENVEERGRDVARDAARRASSSAPMPAGMRSSSPRNAMGRWSRSAPATTTAARSSPPRRGSPVPAPGTRVAVQVDHTAVIEVPTDLARDLISAARAETASVLVVSVVLFVPGVIVVVIVELELELVVELG